MNGLLACIGLLAAASLAGKDTGDTLVVAIPAPPDSWNPILSQAAEPSMFMYSATAPYLADERFDCRLVHSPNLAKSWEWSEDRCSVTVRLREDRRWEDGRPITAEDVAFTFDLVGDPKILSPRANNLDRFRKERPVEILDPFTLRFHFEQGYNPVLQMSHLTSVGILPKHLLGAIDRSAVASHPFNRRPLAGGIFRIERLTEGQEYVLTPNSVGFPERPAHLDRVVFRVVRDYNVRVAELMQGGVDLAYGLLPADLERAAKNPDLRVMPRGFRWLDYLCWNFRNPLFQSAKTRKALALAVDVDSLIEATQKSGAKRWARRAVSNITPEICGSENAWLKPLPFDLGEAKRLLAEDGWKDSDGDGVLDRAGERFSFRVLTFAGSLRLEQVAQIVQQMFRKAGVEMKIDAREFNKALDDLRSKNFDAALLGWQGEAWIDPSAMLHSGERFPFNYGSYASAKVDELLEKAGGEADPKKAKPLWDELQTVVYEEQPLLFLYWRDVPVVIHRRFRDANASVLGPIQDLDRWWVPKAEQKYKSP